MEVIIIGSSSSCPTKIRNQSSIAVKHNEQTFIFDAGDGTQRELLFNNISNITKIFITHMHGDHVFGLPGLLCSLCSKENSNTLEIYGPKGLKKYIDNIIENTFSIIKRKYIVYEIINYENEDISTHASTDVTQICANLEQVDLNQPLHWIVFEDDNIKVLAARLEHTILCYGYVLIEKTATESQKNGRKIVILGDTCDSNDMMYIGQNADILIHEATHANFTKNANKEQLDLKAVKYGHSTPEMAGKFAQSINAKKMILTHFSPFFKDKDFIKIRNLAKEYFNGMVIISCDGLKISI